DRLDEPGAVGVPAAAGVAQVSGRAVGLRHPSDRCRFLPAVVREAQPAPSRGRQGRTFVSRPSAGGPCIRTGAHARLRGLGPRPADQSGVLVAACSSKTSLIAASPAAMVACIISRTPPATSGSAGSTHRNDRATSVRAVPASVNRVVMYIVVGWSA